MGQVFRRETTFDKLFEEFAIDPEKTTVEIIDENQVEVKEERLEKSPQEEKK